MGDAKADTKAMFLKCLTEVQVTAIQRVFRVGQGEFWRDAKGRAFLDLPPEFVRGLLEFGE